MADFNLGEELTKQRRKAEEQDAQRRAAKLHLPYLNPVGGKTPIEIKALTLIPEEEAKKSLAAGLQAIKNDLVLAAFDPQNTETQKLIIRLKQKYNLHIFITSLSGLKAVWNYYQYAVEEGKEISGQVDIEPQRLKTFQENIKTLTALNQTIDESKSKLTSQILEIILAGSLSLKASDIHLEPTEEKGLLRLRIDGLLHSAYEKLPLKTYQSLISRLKLLSNLKLNIHDQPQDGRFTIKTTSREIEIRASVIPSEWGETVVLRILDPESLKVNLEELGWRTDDLEIVKKEIKKPNGLILNTGPTGSGKTTTLYAFLKFIFKPEIKIITIEDPVEYHLSGISQTQVDPGAGYTFASGLRSILRQDPDVVLVGEIRDKETAEIAMNASLTGHTVFSTLHTNDAVGAIPRLIDLGVKSQILGPALSLVIAQRLIRLLCPVCKVEKRIDQSLNEKIKNFIKNLPSRVDKKPLENFKIYEPRGCDQCGGFGYKGRTSIFELFVINQKMEELIYQNPTEIDLKAAAKKQEMVTMQEDSLLKALQGITSLTEVERLTGPLEWS